MFILLFNIIFLSISIIKHLKKTVHISGLFFLEKMILENFKLTTFKDSVLTSKNRLEQRSGIEPL